MIRRLSRSFVPVAALLAALLLPALPAGAATPTISSFSPTSGPVGTSVTIRGSGFSPTPLTVRFNGVLASKPKVNAAGTRITVRVPPLATSGPISVSTPTGSTGYSADPFTVTFGAWLSPHSLWAGQVLSIAGSAYPPDTDVGFSINGTVPLDGAYTDGNGNFSVGRTIPEIPPGKTMMLEIVCLSVECATVELNFSIYGDWPQTRFDETQSGFSSVHWKIGTGNVGGLHRQYSFGGLPETAQAVEKGGRLYIGDGFVAGGRVISRQVGANSGAIYTYTLPRGPTGIAVDGSTLFAVTWETLYAFDATAVSNCIGPPTARDCSPLWTAALGTGAYPFPPVVADGKVFLGTFGSAKLLAFDEAGITNCSGSPKTCTPLWSVSENAVFGAPAVSALSDGGSGTVYVGAATNSNRVFAYTEAGAFVNKSQTLPQDQPFGPALAGGRLAVTGWSAGSSAAVLTVIDASSMNVLWSSANMGGSSVPSAPVMTGSRVYVANSSGRLLAFKASGCATPPCAPQFTSAALGPGNSVAPIVANGVVYTAANALADTNGLDTIYAFDATGSINCSGSPVVCTPLKTIATGITGYPGTVGTPGGMMIAGLTLYGIGGDSLFAFIP